MVSLARGLRLLNTFLLAIGVNLLARDGGGAVATLGYLVSAPLIVVGIAGGGFWAVMLLGDVLERR